jgi:hypothetical protein
MTRRSLAKRLDEVEALIGAGEDGPSHVLVTVVNTGHRRDPEDDTPAPAGEWSPDEVSASGLTVVSLPRQPDAAFHARAAKLARRADPGMMPVLLPVWRPHPTST